LSRWYVLPLPPAHCNQLINLPNKQLPFWFLVSFGAWLLFRLGWGMFTFRDTPDAYAELMEEIKEAKADLRAKGVTVD
jgi:dolichyl-phosphate mannosyltransferase polypeptide 3